MLRAITVATAGEPLAAAAYAVANAMMGAPPTTPFKLHARGLEAFLFIEGQFEVYKSTTNQTTHNDIFQTKL